MNDLSFSVQQKFRMSRIALASVSNMAMLVIGTASPLFKYMGKEYFGGHQMNCTK